MSDPRAKLTKKAKPRKRRKWGPKAVSRQPEVRREKALQERYGISIADYETMLKAQKGGCWICGRPPKKRRLNIDHDHKTGIVRGLLCFSCNWGLSWFKDNAERLEKAAAYIRKQLSPAADLPALPDIPAIHFEWCNNRWGTIHDHIEIASKNAGAKIPVVLETRPGQPWLAILPLDKFLQFVKFYRPVGMPDDIKDEIPEI